jgi:hypothetical protein
MIHCMSQVRQLQGHIYPAGADLLLVLEHYQIPRLPK